jgi:hypothetical protein
MVSQAALFDAVLRILPLPHDIDHVDLSEHDAVIFTWGACCFRVDTSGHWTTLRGDAELLVPRLRTRLWTELSRKAPARRAAV